MHNRFWRIDGWTEALGVRWWVWWVPCRIRGVGREDRPSREKEGTLLLEIEVDLLVGLSLSGSAFRLSMSDRVSEKLGMEMLRIMWTGGKSEWNTNS